MKTMLLTVRCRFSLLMKLLTIAGLCSLMGHRAQVAHGAAPPTIQTVAAPADVQPIKALQEPSGQVHLVADSKQGPVYLHSTDYGRTFSQPLPLVDSAARQPGLEFNVWDAALAPNGKLYVALGTNAWKLKLPKEQWGLHLVIRDPATGTFSPVRNINRKPSEGFSLAVNNDGTVVACWLADKLYANVSLDDGVTFADAVEINASFNPCNCCTTTSTFLADGRLAILYREETNNNRDMFVVYWDLQNNKVSWKPVSTTNWKIDACPMTYYSVASSGKGLLAAWPTKKSIYLAKLDETGRLQPPGEVKTDGMAGMRTGLTTVENSSGELLLVWNEEGRIGYRAYNSQLKPLGPAATKTTRGKGVAAFRGVYGAFVVI
ncbi:MAG: sialidase family protein, partial [Planctomycetota bacterium]